MKKILNKFERMKMHSIVLLVCVTALNGCSSTVNKTSSQTVQTQAQQQTQNELQDRSKHQADHGASVGHRALFIDEYDVNSDREVTHAEFIQARAAKLKSMDANGDGLVDETEYLDHFTSELEKKINGERKEEILQTEIRFKSIDTNGDGKMTWDEYWASGLSTFTHFAKSENGVVSLQSKDKEWDAAPAPKNSKGKKIGDQKKTESEKKINSETKNTEVIRPAIINMPSSHSLEGFIEINDLNGDQRVTADEFRQIRRGIFDATDTNKDGWISPEEYTAEFTNRLDRQIKQVRDAQMKQAKVRYTVLNTNHDAGISAEEFNVSGERIFNGWDLNNDGKVSDADPLPKINENKQLNENKKVNENKQVSEHAKPAGK